ncbi:hypothetical protein ACFL6H_06935 [Candidatus Latescibacterota bacterium]
MRALLVIFIALSISIFGDGCLLNSDSKDKGEKDSGTYILKADTTAVSVYPNGGVLINLTFEPGETFSGDVYLEFHGPSFLQGSFFDDELTLENHISDLLVKVDKTAIPGVTNCRIISNFAGHSDTIRIAFEIVEGEFLKDITYTPALDILEWFEEQNTSWGTLHTETWYGYSFYPEMMVGGIEWIAVSDRWVLRQETTPYPPAKWYSIRRRDERESLMHALAVKDTIIQVELTTFPANMADREKYINQLFDFDNNSWKF